jgi:hypothetical protein
MSAKSANSSSTHASTHSTVSDDSAYPTKRRLSVSAIPSASDTTLANPRSGQELAVLGRVLAGSAPAAPELAAPGAGDVVWARADDAAGAALPAAGDFARVALTSFSVMTRGGLDVMIVALS